MLSVHDFEIAGSTATGSFLSSSDYQWLDTTYAIPIADGGSGLNLVLSVTGTNTALPINQTTGLDANGIRSLWDIVYSGSDWNWTLAEYSR